MVPGSVRHHDARMQLISASSGPIRRPVSAIVSGTLVGAVLVAGGLSLAYLAFATPLLGMLLPSGRTGPAQIAVGVVVMSMALVAPLTFVAVGANRLARLFQSMRPHESDRSAVERLAGTLPADVVGASDIPLRDGRNIPALLIGPFGVIVLREAPSSSMTRVQGSAWEARTRNGWIPIENPMERCARDAERVRHWLSDLDRDFLVKTYAAVIERPGQGLPRSAACAVFTTDQLPSFIESLPAQRSLTGSRLDSVIAQVREAVESA
jgi:hypothetical protein